MRLKRNYCGVVKNFLSWFFSRFKPLTVHTEAIFIDSVWEKIKEKSKSGKVFKWFIMTPANYDYYKTFFSLKLSKKKLSDIMKERYLWMIKNKQKLGVHVHLAMLPSQISKKEQTKIIEESLDWMKKELKLTPKDFVPGWWAYNEDTIDILKKNNLKLIKSRDYDFMHDFDFIKLK